MDDLSRIKALSLLTGSVLCLRYYALLKEQVPMVELTSETLKSMAESKHVEEPVVTNVTVPVYQGIPRVESVTSLGLNRSESINDQLMELGEFCSTGQTLIVAAKYSLPLCIAFVSYLVLAKQKN